MKKYDVIINGAGLAGCVLGYLLRKQNKKVLIIEQKKLKYKDKLCGGILTKKSYDLLSDIYGDSIRNMEFISHNNVNIINSNKELKFDVNLYTISRKELDDFVVEQYLKIGGEILDGTTFSNINFEKKQITIKENIYIYIYSFGHLVGADGTLSSIRKNANKKNQRMNFALEGNLSISDKKIAIYFFDKLKSYGWVIPNNNSTMVGIGDVSGKVKLEEDFTAYLKQIDMKATNAKGAFLPTGNDILLESSDSIKYIGDAAGLISPITGEGIYYAIISAKILSEDFINYKTNMKKIIKRIKSEDVFKNFVYNHRLRNFVFNRENHPLLKKVINKFIEKIL